MCNNRKSFVGPKTLNQILVFLAITIASLLVFAFLESCAHEPSQRAIQAEQNRIKRKLKKDSIAYAQWANELKLNEGNDTGLSNAPQTLLIESTLYTEGDESGWVKYKLVDIQTGEVDQAVFANQFPVFCIEQVIAELTERGKHSDFWSDIRGWNWVIIDSEGCLSMAIER